MDQHTSLDIMVIGLDYAKLNRQPEPGKWSINDNIAHLAVYQPIMINRVKTILEMDSPLFDPYRADDDKTFLDWRQWTADDLLSRLYADRENLFRLIANLSKQELSRTGTHLKFGKMTIVQWTEFFLLHEAHHQFTIFKLVQSN